MRIFKKYFTLAFLLLSTTIFILDGINTRQPSNQTKLIIEVINLE